jgi:hypothetical protein
MNFLSHYYFDRYNPNSYESLGCLLPDLVKNTDRKWNIYPEKLNPQTFLNPLHQQILSGWKKHLQVDIIFHSSEFFLHHQHQLKQSLKLLLGGSPVKPFFLAHIGVELLLDSLLISKNLVEVDKLYQHLDDVDESVLNQFLEISHIPNIPLFDKFFISFKKEKYLWAYADDAKISYSLKRICMRIWENPFSEEKENELTTILTDYKLKLSQDFIFIFDFIAARLNYD